MPLHTSRYVGFGVTPAAYPTAVLYTPSSCQNFFSAPQKHPIPNTARCSPSGNGGSRLCLLTKCDGDTSMRSERPDKASAFDGRRVGLENIRYPRSVSNKKAESACAPSAWDSAEPVGYAQMTNVTMC